MTEIDIAKPPSEVWAVLTDTASYPAWNPGMRLIGQLEPGQVIEHDQGEGSDRAIFHPTVQTVRPQEELRWTGRIWSPILFAAEHYFLLSATQTGTHFVQGENFRGVALWFFDVRDLLSGFMKMNGALKKRVEALPPPVNNPASGFQ